MLSRERIAAERLLCRVLVAAAVFFAAAWLIPQVWDKLSPFLIAIPIGMSELKKMALADPESIKTETLHGSSSS